MELDFFDASIVGFATLLIVGVSVFTHYEGLTFLSRVINRLTLASRSRIVFLILGIVMLHAIEIWIFGVGYYVLLQYPNFGALAGLANATLPDCVYYSTVVYTTLGFGDLIPTDDIRFLTGSEALLGLVLITWSASFTFIEMQKRWET